MKSNRNIKLMYKSNPKKLVFLILFLLCFSTLSWGQDRVFSEAQISKIVFKNEKWNVKVTPTWKHIYAKIGWRRAGLNIAATRKLKQWSLLAGITNNYTFDKQIDNYYEFRPWIGIGLDSPISHRFLFAQKIKWEWRYLAFKKDSEKDNYGRFRYNINLTALLTENKEKGTLWKVQGFIEWYFLNNPAKGELFPNFREIGFNFTHQFKNKDQISFGYKIESYYDSAKSLNGNGHIFTLGYKL